MRGFSYTLGILTHPPSTGCLDVDTPFSLDLHRGGGNSAPAPPAAAPSSPAVSSPASSGGGGKWQPKADWKSAKASSKPSYAPAAASPRPPT